MEYRISVNVDGEMWRLWNQQGATGNITKKDMAYLQRVAFALEEALKEVKGEMLEVPLISQ